MLSHYLGAIETSKIFQVHLEVILKAANQAIVAFWSRTNVIILPAISENILFLRKSTYQSYWLNN